MYHREQDDELDRMRARRGGSSRVRRPAPPRGREEEYGDPYYDEDYFEEEYPYVEENEGYEAGFSHEPEEEWEPLPTPRPRRPRAAGTGRDSLRSEKKRGASAPAASRPPSPRRGTRSSRKTDLRSAGHDRGGRGKAASGRQEQVVKRKKKRGLKSILLLLLVLVIGYGVWLFLHRPTGYWTVAVFGVDSRDGGTEKALADVQMICSIDRSTGEIKLVSVYRDTYLKINSEGTYHKINEAYMKGGRKQAVAALEENLDLKIDDYATFNWKSVAEAINILGGIDLEITQSEFDFINGFITETVESTGIASVHLTQPGMNHLDGVQAVAYCRLRLMDTDFQRTERQRKVVMLALDKAKQADVSTLTSLAGYLIQQISTSVSVKDVLPLVKDIEKYHIGETAGFPFARQSMRVGRMDCVIAATLESNVTLLHQFLYGEDVSYSPSSAVKKISAHISEETGLYEEGKAAPSGGSTGTGSSKGEQGGQKAPAPTPPPETAPAETLPEESREETTEETTEEETQETTEETGETEEEIGPGVSREPSKSPETEESDEKGPGVEGPGAEGPGAEKPEETTAGKPEPSPETERPEEGPGGGPSFGGPGEEGPE